jgi:hypothetical protein
VIAQPPPPAPHNEPEEDNSEGEEDYDLPDVDLGQEEENSEDAEGDTPLQGQETPLPDGERPLPVGYPPLPETPPPLPETPPQSEGMVTRAQARGGEKLKHVPAARTSRQLGHLAKPPPPARESTGQDQEQQGLEEEDELMLRRGMLRPHAIDEDGQDGPTEEKRVYNRGERREHDAEWEEPLLKRIRHLKEMTMRAEAARAGKRFKHVVTALSVMSYEMGQKNLYRTLAAMTDGQLLAALEAGSVELSINGATPPTRQPTPPAPQPANTHPATPRRNLPSLPTQPNTPPSQPERKRARFSSNSKQARLTGNRDGGDSSGPTRDSRARTALHSRAAAARISQERTSQQRTRLKLSRPRPHQNK